MFETALLSQRRQRRRTSLFAAAIGAHAVLLGGVVAAQYWKVDAVQEPQMNDVFHVQLPTPPLAKAQEPERKKAAAPAPIRKEDVVVPTPAAPPTPQAPTQPDAVPDQIPPTPAQPDTGGDDTAAPHQGSGGGALDGVDGSLGDGTGDGPIQIGLGMTPPVALSRVAPLYTEAARRARIQGVVIVEAVIDRAGNVVDARVLKGLGFGLDENAANAVTRWKFRPATARDGRTVSVYFRLTVDYHLN